MITSSSYPASPTIFSRMSHSKLRSRGIVHSVTESGVARLIFDEDFTHFRGLLLNSREESISLTGSQVVHSLTNASIDELVVDTNKNLDPTAPTTSRMQMQIVVVDGETGDKFCIENVEVTRTPKAHERILIGNRADVEIQQYLGSVCSEPILHNGGGSYSTLSRMGSRALAANRTQVHLGHMSLNVIASERTEPSVRRISACDGCATNIIEQSNDFLV
uniref:Uncharacterized protein n=1 Tax=Ditylenchus dipsaci TaxID=166011 RepID=A0A915EP08_9BILA